MSDVILVGGLFVNKPHEKAPDFVKANLSIKVSEFAQFVKKHTNDKGYLNIDILESQKGKYYAKLNTFVPTNLNNNDDSNPDDDLPF